MENIDLKEYGPIISDKETGEVIYNLIIKEIKNSKKVSINLGGIKSMATFCAKQIFGKLYVELGSEVFFQNIQLENASDDLKTIIKIGIKSALDE